MEPSSKKIKLGTTAATPTEDYLWSLAPVFGVGKDHTPGIEVDFASFFKDFPDHSSIRHILLCNYMLDWDWMLECAPILEQSLLNIDIVHGGDIHMHDSLGRGIGKRGTVLKAKVPPYGTHHSKMAIVYSDTHVRVCITTANFIARDWTFKTQGCWVKDFPLKSARGNAVSPSADASIADDFPEVITRYLRSYGTLGARHGDQLNRYCLLGSGVRLVASVPGHYRGANPQQWWGLGRLAVLLRQLPLSSPSPSSPPLPSVPLSSDTATTPTAPPLSERYPCLTLQFSSLGWLSQKWFDDQFCRTMLTLPSLPSPPHLDLSSTPVLKREENEKSTAISKSGEKTSPPPLKGKRARSSPSRPSASVRIVWPSVNAVRQSFEGYEAGGSLCCNAKNIKPFLRSIMREWDGRLTARQLAMPHIKTYTRHSADGSRILWSLLTSANLSKSAWGEWIADGSLVVKSYELGVLFSSSPTNRLLSEQAKLSLEGREDGPSQHIPLPFSLPPLHSSSQQHYKPWVWDQPSSLLDSHGRVFTP